MNELMVLTRARQLVVTWFSLFVFARLVPADPKVDFARDVQPLLHGRCASCHGQHSPQGGLSVYSHAGLLKGGISGPAVIPGSSGTSLIIQRLSGAKQPRMPLNGGPLSDYEINMLKAWIDEGAEWKVRNRESSIVPTLALRKPDLPSASRSHPIDAFLESYFRDHHITPPGAVPDDLFIRRSYLDLWGLLPTPEQRKEFRNDPRPDKREYLIDQLLSERRNYAEHWISYWNDLLRNDEGVKYPAGKRESITRWLLHALETNMPYNKIVASLLNPVGVEAPKGFLVGVNWGGDASASQTPPMQAAQDSAQVFLGASLKCAGCHDSFVSRWKLRDTYGLAAFFSEEPLEIVRCDIKTGEKAVPRFPFDLDHVNAGPTLAEHRALAAELFTSSRNGRFARTIVNRYWKQLFGRGLVEPADDMDSPAWHVNLLEWLACDFVEHDCDLQFLLRRIMTSKAYQLPAVAQSSSAEDGNDYVFRGPTHRRLTAEQFLDAVSSITGEWRILEDNEKPGGTFARDWRFKSGMLTRALGRPNRNQVFTSRDTAATTLQAMELVNGREITALLQMGAKRMMSGLKPAPPNLFDSGILTSTKAIVDIDITGVEQLRLLTVDAGSYAASDVVSGWSEAQLIGPLGVVPLMRLPLPQQAQKKPLQVKGEPSVDALVTALPCELAYDIQGKGYTRFRAVVGVDESSLRPEINGKVRFFVFSEEPDRTQLIRVTGQPPVPRRNYTQTGRELTRQLYAYALSRNPTILELTAGREPAEQFTADDLEDLLWTIFLSPEFQYIR